MSDAASDPGEKSRERFPAYRNRGAQKWHQETETTFLHVDEGPHPIDTEDGVCMVSVTPCWVAQTPVTILQFKSYLSAIGKPFPPGPWPDDSDAPMTRVSYDDAKAYCAWSGTRLVTEDEWQVAMQHRGIEVEPGVLGFSITESTQGAIHRLGVNAENAWEWTSTPFDEDDSECLTVVNPAGPEFRLGGGTAYSAENLGFRVAIDVVDSPEKKA